MGQENLLLNKLGLKINGKICRNLPIEKIIEEGIKNEETTSNQL